VLSPNLDGERERERERERDSMLSFCIVKSFDNSNVLQFKIKELK
jgi:hypothetical protein